MVELTDSFEDNAGRWEKQADGSWHRLPKQKQSPVSLAPLREQGALLEGLLAEQEAVLAGLLAEVAALSGRLDTVDTKMLAAYGRLSSDATQTITRGTGDQHVTFDGDFDGESMGYDTDGLVVVEPGLYAAQAEVRYPYNQTGGGTNGHFNFTLGTSAHGLGSGAWVNTNTTSGSHSGTATTQVEVRRLAAGDRLYVRVEPMPTTGCQTVLRSGGARLHAWRVAP